MLEVRDLAHRYNGTEVLRVPAWEVPRGAASLVVGPSGSGKSTLLGAIAGLLTPSAGRILVEGEEITALSGAGRDRFRARRIGIVPQTLHLIGVLSARGNLALARRLAGLPEDRPWLDQCLARLGIGPLAARKASQLSVGEAQRVAIARAVVNRPALILADEPTSALDDAACAKALALLREEARACGATLVVATHDQRVREHFDLRLEL